MQTRIVRITRDGQAPQSLNIAADATIEVICGDDVKTFPPALEQPAAGEAAPQSSGGEAEAEVI